MKSLDRPMLSRITSKDMAYVTVLERIMLLFNLLAVAFVRNLQKTFSEKATRVGLSFKRAGYSKFEAYFNYMNMSKIA
jgi:hypothetical protein